MDALLLGLKKFGPGAFLVLLIAWFLANANIEIVIRFPR
jgi:hypothetical protein